MKRYELYAGYFENRTQANNAEQSDSGQWVRYEDAKVLKDVVEMASAIDSADDYSLKYIATALANAARQALTQTSGEE